MPKPNDSNDYLYRLIYFLSCNNCLPFHVFKTSFKEIRSPNHYISRLKDVEHFDWFFWLNMRNSCFVFFRNWVPVHANHAFVPWSRIYQPQHYLLYFICIFFLSVRSISWYSSILSFNSRYIFCTGVIPSQGWPSPHHLLVQWEKINREQFARLNLSIICRCLNWDIFILYYCKPKRSTIY